MQLSAIATSIFPTSSHIPTGCPFPGICWTDDPYRGPLPAAQQAAVHANTVSWPLYALLIAGIAIGIILPLLTTIRHRHTSANRAETVRPYLAPDVAQKGNANQPVLQLGHGAPDPLRKPPAHEIRTLGPLTITGCAGHPGDPVKTLLLALALRDGHEASKDHLLERLGPNQDQPITDGYFRQICTRARHTLGTATDGRPLLQHTQAGYALHPELVVDWDRFQALVDRGEPDDLRAALDQVHGEPLEGCYHWWIDPLLIETRRVHILETAATLSTLELHNANPTAAANAARRGLLVDSLAEPLYALLLQAQSAAGDVAGIRRTYKLYLQRLDEADIKPYPTTVALYHQLTNRPVASRTA
jgi:DNA-binding SARP family transcriptional activator